MIPHAHRPIEVEQNAGELVIRVRAEAQPLDELVAVTREALEPLGLEYKPVLALSQAGTLRTVWIGRRRFTRRSWLVALADTLPPAVEADEGDELLAAARRKAARRVSP